MCSACKRDYRFKKVRLVYVEKGKFIVWELDTFSSVGHSSGEQIKTFKKSPGNPTEKSPHTRSILKNLIAMKKKTEKKINRHHE